MARMRRKFADRPTKKVEATDTKGSPKDDRQSQVEGGKEYVKKELGLMTTVPSPLPFMQNEKKTKAYNLKGKDRDFYGKEASKAADDYLVKTGKVKVGNYFRQVGGNFIRIDKAEGERLYASGDPSISRSTIGTKKSKSMKYGMTGGAMGSGDPTGIMSSTPISAKMHERQKTIQAIALGAMSLAFPQTGVGALGGFGLRTTAADALKNRGQKGYNEYMKKFEKKQATVMGSKRAAVTGGKTFMTEEY
tara:strand:- start:317 stop:1060 length:744 start_codon:yes stop_codon:yes gene_type:complete